jgi:hypothetical protein
VHLQDEFSTWYLARQFSRQPHQPEAALRGRRDRSVKRRRSPVIDVAVAGPARLSVSTTAFRDVAFGA